jgi:hypothetical protein
MSDSVIRKRQMQWELGLKYSWPFPLGAQRCLTTEQVAAVRAICKKAKEAGFSKLLILPTAKTLVEEDHPVLEEFKETAVLVYCRLCH